MTLLEYKLLISFEDPSLFLFREGLCIKTYIKNIFGGI